MVASFDPFFLGLEGALIRQRRLVFRFGAIKFLAAQRVLGKQVLIAFVGGLGKLPVRRGGLQGLLDLHNSMLGFLNPGLCGVNLRVRDAIVNHSQKLATPYAVAGPDANLPHGAANLGVQ